MRLFLLLIVAVASSSALETEPSRAQKSTNFCQGCRSIVSYMSQFNESKSRDEYRELFKNFCELYYPVSTDYQQGPCPVFVEGFFYVLERVDPVYHCDQIGACKATDEEAIIKTNYEVSRDDGPICKVCEQIVTQVKKQLEDPDFVKQVQERIDAFCGYLQVIGQEEICKQMLRQNLDEAIEMIEATEPETYCQSLQLCSKSKLPESKTKFPSLVDFSDFGIETSVEIGGQTVKDISFFDHGSNPSCAFCKTLVSELFKFVRKNRTEISIRNALDQICSLVYPQGSKRDQCDQLVATYSKEFIEVLSMETDPELVCIMMSQCTKELPNQLESSRHEVTSTLESPEVTMSEFISILDPTIQVGSLRSCVECKLFIQYLQNTLNRQQSEEQLKEWLITNLCNSLQDETMKSSCVSLVQKRAAEFFKAIAENLNPQLTCQELGACKPRRYPITIEMSLRPFLLPQTLQPSMISSEVPMLEQKSIIEPTNSKPKTPFCDGCVNVVSKIDEYLSAHSIQNDVNELVTEVCEKLPLDRMKKGCTLLIKYYGHQIMEHISTMDDPLHLCTKISLC